MESKAFMLILFSLTVALATESNSTLNRLIEATNTSPFAQCNPFNAQAKGITSCEEYFESSSLTFEACDLNLGWHDICVGAIPEEKGSLREICPTECATKVLDPELEDDDAVAVENFIDFLKKDDSKNGQRSPRRNAAGRRKLEAAAGYESYPGYGSGPGNLLVQFDDLDVEECANRCNGQGTLCEGFTIHNTRCNLKAAITLTQNGAKTTYVKIVAPVAGYEFHQNYASGSGNLLAQFDDLTAEECADLCNEQGTLCAGFTIFDHGRCNLKAAITLTQNRRTFNRATYVKIVAPDATWTHVGYGGCTGGNWMNIGTATTLEDAKALVLAHDQCSAEGSMLFYSWYSYHSSWGVRCATADHHDDCTEANPNWQEYILSYNDVTWTHVGYGGCTGGNWMNIGTATTLEDAKALVLAHDQCSADGSMLFYSMYSYHSSWGVRCATADDHDDCTEANPNWQEYILSYNV